MPRTDILSAPTLAVGRGQRITLSANRPPNRDAIVTRLRPITATALRTITPTPRVRRTRAADPQAIKQPARLSDDAAFEEPGDAAGLVDVRQLSGVARIDGFSPRFLRTVIQNLDVDETASGHVWLRPENPTTRGQHFPVQVPVPAVVANRGFVSAGFTYSNIWLGPDATLVIADDVSHLLCLNFTAHETARIVQEAPHVTLDVMGLLVGGASLHSSMEDQPAEEIVAKIPKKPLTLGDLPALPLQLLPPGI